MARPRGIYMRAPFEIADIFMSTVQSFQNSVPRKTDVSDYVYDGVKMLFGMYGKTDQVSSHEGRKGGDYRQ